MEFTRNKSYTTFKLHINGFEISIAGRTLADNLLQDNCDIKIYLDEKDVTKDITGKDEIYNASSKDLFEIIQTITKGGLNER